MKISNLFNIGDILWLEGNDGDFHIRCLLLNIDEKTLNLQPEADEEGRDQESDINRLLELTKNGTLAAQLFFIQNRQRYLCNTVIQGCSKGENGLKINALVAETAVDGERRSYYRCTIPETEIWTLLNIPAVKEFGDFSLSGTIRDISGGGLRFRIEEDVVPDEVDLTDLSQHKCQMIFSIPTQKQPLKDTGSNCGSPSREVKLLAPGNSVHGNS